MASVEKIVVITVLQPNRAPVVDPSMPTELSMNVDETHNFGQYFSDPDGDTLTYSFVEPIDGLEIDSSTGVVTAKKAGVYNANIKADDGKG